MTSTRNGFVLCALLALALAPTVLHTYLDARTVEPRRAAVLPETLAGFTSTPTARNDAWAMRRFQSDDWIERRYVRDGQDAVLTVVRSYDLKRLYHHPELAVAYGTGFVGQQVVEPPQHPGTAVHVLMPADADVSASYVLHYGGDYVADPISFQIRTAGTLLFSPQKAMTLFFVLAHHRPGMAAHDQPNTLDLLFAAIDRVTGPGADAAR